MKYVIKDILPLTSIVKAAWGRFGNYVFYMRNGKICARIYIVPPNPNSKRQKKDRRLFAKAVKDWQLLDEEEKQMWKGVAKTLKKRGYNLYLSMRMKELLQIAAEEAEIEALKKVKPRRRVRVIHSHRVIGVGAVRTRNTSQEFLFPRILKGP